MKIAPIPINQSKAAIFYRFEVKLLHTKYTPKIKTRMTTSIKAVTPRKINKKS